jgi:broad-specificity NMP kinase
MKRIGFVGVPGVGKTSTARALTAYCRQNEFKNIELVAEYARRFISKYGDIDTMSDQFRVTEKQIEWDACSRLNI